MLSRAVQPPAQADYCRDGNGSRSFLQGTQEALKGKARQQAVRESQGRWPCSGQGRAQLQGDVPWNRLGASWDPVGEDQGQGDTVPGISCTPLVPLGEPPPPWHLGEAAGLEQETGDFWRASRVSSDPGEQERHRSGS